MGRLTLRGRPRQLLRAWALPIAVALLLLVGVHTRVRADVGPSTDELIEYLKTNQLDAYSQPAGDYQQVFYTYQNKSVQLTDTPYNHVSVVYSGQFIAWTGAFGGDSQIYVYDVLNSSLIQITGSGTNQSPYIRDGRVTWQHWDGDSWQVYYYDRLNVTQLSTASTSSVRASINGQSILYAQQVAPNDWKAMLYDIPTGQTSVVKQGDEASTAYPQFRADGSIKTGFLE